MSVHLQTTDNQDLIDTGDMKTEPTDSSSTPTGTTEWDTLRADVRANPFDTNLWTRFIDMSEETGDAEKIKEAYEAVLEQYPNSASTQIAYLNHSMSHPSALSTAQSLFGRFLRPSPSVDLWKSYIDYVRRANQGVAARETIKKVYDFALQHVGHDKDSGSIWSDYISFLKEGETKNTWEEQQKMDALRKTYHRAVQIPLENVETLWKELDSFENGLNKITAKKFLSDLNPAYMTARTALRELRKHMAVLYPPAPNSSSSRPALQLPQRPIFSQNDRAQVAAWKAYLKWEESNPLEYEDKSALFTRVQGAYKKAVIKMRFFPEIWYMAYVYMSGISKQEEAMSILEAGMEANPKSFLLHTCYAEQLELSQNVAEVHKVYTKLLDGIREDLESIEARELSAASISLDSEGAVNTSMDSTLTNGASSSFSSQRSDDKPGKSAELVRRKQDYGLAYIMYIRFALRAEGVESSRVVFAKARREKWTPWEVFEAAALMEYHVGKQPTIAQKVFTIALHRFSDEIEFVLRYLSFLMSINDENNARALFEQAIGQFPPETSRPIWDRWARFEYQYGSLENALKLEKRMCEAFPTDTPIKRFAYRHTYLHIDSIASGDLGVVTSRHGLSSSGSGTSSGSSGSSSALGRTDTQLLSNSPSSTTIGDNSMQSQSSVISKRATSPDRGRRDDSTVPHKRSRVSSPPRDRDRDRDRWDSSSKGRRYGSPVRDRDRPRSPPRRVERDREEPERPPPVSQVLSWFLGSLPPATSFDGPVFRTDDLINVFRTAVIPGSSGIRPRSPPPPSRPAGRPPPDYSPYQGPNRPARRY